MLRHERRGFSEARRRYQVQRPWTLLAQLSEATDDESVTHGGLKPAAVHHVIRIRT